MVFVWWPKRLPNGTIVWLEWVRRTPLYFYSSRF